MAPTLLPARRSGLPSRGRVLKVDVSNNLPALTAAALRVTRKDGAYMRRLIQPWQARALSYYDLVGECWNAAQFYSRSMKQVRIFAATRDENGEIVEVTDNPDVQEQVARIQDPGGGGYSRLMDSYGRLKFLIGEGYFLITNPDGDDEGWEFVSPDELRLTGAGEYTRFAAPSLPAEILVDVPDSAYKPVGDQALIYRVWRPSPRFSLLADSPIRAVLDILEELVLLTLAVRGTAKSRLVRNGILYIPDEISPPAMEAIGDEDLSKDPFLSLIQEQLLSGIVNPGTAAAVAPALMRGPAEYAANIKWIQVSDPMETYPEEGLRTEAIRRFATGIEMPAELLMGTADVNHWGAWLIDEQAAKNYIFPACQDLVDDLTAVFLRPTLRDAGVPNWDEFVIGYDASAIVQHPDRAKDAKDAHDRLVISDKTLRNSLDFNDSDAPPQDELERRIATKINDPSALTEPYEVQTTDDVNADEQQTGEEGAPTETSSEDVTKDAPVQPESPDGLAARRGEAIGACRSAIVRSREIAGNRLRTLARTMDAEKFATSRTAFEDLPKVPASGLAAALGPDWVRTAAGRSLPSLVKGGDAGLIETLEAAGIASDVASTLGSMVTTHAARTLYAPVPRHLPTQILAFIERSIR